jgi:hypothetical protein
MRTVQRARERFPGSRSSSRAHSRTDAYEYTALGVPSVRERSARRSMRERRAATPRTQHRAGARGRPAVPQLDEQRLVQLAPHRNDEQQLIAFARKERENLNQLLTNEAADVPAATARAD